MSYVLYTLHMYVKWSSGFLPNSFPPHALGRYSPVVIALLNDALTALRRARTHLAGLLTSQPKLAEPLGQILGALVEAEEALAGLEGDGASGPAKRGEPSSVGRKPKRYERQMRGGEECVAEFRSDSPYPFRVPKAVLDAVVDVLVASGRALRFADLRSALADRLGSAPADYQLHACLRLLFTRGLIRARRRTYSLADAKSFRRQAAALWRALPLAEHTHRG